MIAVVAVVALVALAPGDDSNEIPSVGRPIFVLLPSPMTATSSTDRNGVRTTRGRARCASVSADGRGGGDSVVLDVSVDGLHASFFAAPFEAGWRLRGMRLSSSATKSGVRFDCTVDVAAVEAGVVRRYEVLTDHGPVFVRAHACDDWAREPFETVCTGERCVPSPHTAPIFDVGPCAGPLARAQAQLSAIAAATETERLYTTMRAAQVWARGDKLFDRVGETCRMWTVAPTAPLTATLTAVTTTPEQTTTETMTLALSPLAHRAVESARSTSSVTPTGGRGFGGSGGRGDVALEFAAGHFYVDDRAFFFNADACAAYR